MIPYERRRKLDNKAKEVTFVGYDENSKGYRLIDRNNKLIISREVKFIHNQTKHRKISRKFKRKMQNTLKRPEDESPESKLTEDELFSFGNDFQEENNNINEEDIENEDSEDSFQDAEEENQSQEESNNAETSSEEDENRNEPVIIRRRFL